MHSPSVADSARTTDVAGAGSDETIPRAFLGSADVVTLVVSFAVTGLIAPWVRFVLLWGHEDFEPFPPLASFAWVLIAACPLTVLFMELLGGYSQLVLQSRTRIVTTSVLAPSMALSFLALAFFALKISSSSRVFVFTFGVLGVLGLLAYRSLLRSYKRQRLESGVYAKNVLFVGKPSAVLWMTQHFRRNVSANRYRVAGWLSLQGADEDGPPDLRALGAVEDLSELLINHPIHEVIAVQSSNERDWLRQVIEDCDRYRVLLRIVPEALLVGNLRDLQLVFRSEPLRLPEVVLAPPHMESDALFVKRLLDLVVSAGLLLLLSPLFLIIALAIKMTTPDLTVFYPWRVIGLKGRPFTGYKFTTMVADAEDRQKDLLARNEMGGPVFKLKDDPRVTRLGRVLRKYSLNELPQLWSVIKGDMSLVGPRPAFRHELDRYELWHKRKLCVKPGITCLWQVSGRNRISDFDEWVRLDLEYIDQWSLWLDLRILARTAWAVVAGTGS